MRDEELFLLFLAFGDRIGQAETGLEASGARLDDLAGRFEALSAAFAAKARASASQAPAHEWKGSRLRFRQPDGSWGRWVDLQGPGGGGGGGLDLEGLPPARSRVPEAFVVRQDGEWRIATLARMRAWLGGGSGPAGVTVNGAQVTVGGATVVATLG